MQPFEPNNRAFYPIYAAGLPGGHGIKLRYSDRGEGLAARRTCAQRQELAGGFKG